MRDARRRAALPSARGGAHIGARATGDMATEYVGLRTATPESDDYVLVLRAAARGADVG